MIIIPSLAPLRATGQARRSLGTAFSSKVFQARDAFTICLIEEVDSMPPTARGAPERNP
jgi:hypothetical protein